MEGFLKPRRARVQRAIEGGFPEDLERCRQHVANEYMMVKGLKHFEQFAATFLDLLAED